MNKYELKNLPYGYKDLEPHISEQVLIIHHDKHHAAYVNAANTLLDRIKDAREKNTELDYKSVLKSLSFNVAGHILHETFWKVMAPADSGKNKPAGKILEAIEKEFGSFERFKTEFLDEENMKKNNINNELGNEIRTGLINSLHSELRNKLYYEIDNKLDKSHPIPDIEKLFKKTIGNDLIYFNYSE